MNAFLLLQKIKEIYNENPTEYSTDDIPLYIKKYIFDPNVNLELLDEHIIKRMLMAIYQDFRFDGKTYYGKRLTSFGLLFIRRFFHAMEYPFKENRPLIVKHLIFLSKNCTLPYYIDKKTIVFFEKDMAFMYRLSGSNMNDFCEAYENLML